MTKKERAEACIARLEEKYPGAQCSLEYQKAHELLISVGLVLPAVYLKGAGGRDGLTEQRLPLFQVPRPVRPVQGGRMRTVVLPLPAPASISTGPVRVLAAWRCMGLRVPVAGTAGDPSGGGGTGCQRRHLPLRLRPQSPTTQRFWCPPASRLTSRYWAWLVSWYSSTMM